MQRYCVLPSINVTWSPGKGCVHKTHRRPLRTCAAGPADPLGSLPEQALEQPQQPQQQQQQQPTRPRAVSQPEQKGPQAAPAQQPGDSQEQLWWVEKFEEKRKQLEQQQQQPTSSSSSSSIPASPSPHAAAPAAAAAGRKAQPIPWPQVVLQLVQLVVAVAALILWPASLYRSGLYNAKIWLLFWTYLLFFGGGSVWRLLQYGPLASRQKDKQAKSLGTRAAWALFVAMMPVLHWGAIGSYIRGRAAAAAAAVAAAGGQQLSAVSGLALYDLIGLVMLAGAVRLNWVAARHLGKAYDRVVQPDALVTTGPYRWVQHPIYSSYTLLFCGYAMMLHSVGYALLALVVCLVYYRSRVALEADVLRGAFGEQYEQYQRRTKLFVPGIL